MNRRRRPTANRRRQQRRFRRDSHKQHAHTCEVWPSPYRDAADSPAIKSPVPAIPAGIWNAIEDIIWRTEPPIILGRCKSDFGSVRPNASTGFVSGTDIQLAVPVPGLPAQFPAHGSGGGETSHLQTR